MNFLKNLFKKKTPSTAITLKIRNADEHSERDRHIFHACFTLLCEFVENDAGGLDGLATYMNTLEAASSSNGSHVTAFGKLADLYSWYTTIDWNNPSQFTTPEYDNLLNSGRIKMGLEPIDDANGNRRYTVDLQGTPEDIEFYETEREKIIMSEEQFELLCTKKLVELVKLRPYLWI
jgi:hypothetical protein